MSSTWFDNDEGRNWFISNNDSTQTDLYNIGQKGRIDDTKIDWGPFDFNSDKLRKVFTNLPAHRSIEITYTAIAYGHWY